MLASVFLTSLAALVCSTVLLFVRRGDQRPPARSVWALLATFAWAAFAGSAAAVAGFGTSHSLVAAAAMAAVGVAWLPMTRDWNIRGHLAWTSLSLFAVSYLGYMLVWTFRSRLGAFGTAGGLLLWFLEVAGFLLGMMYSWELVDVLARRNWRRRCPEGVDAGTDAAQHPFVSLHVPAYNEPPEMVIETLASLRGLDYPAFEIVMIDDNTTDEGLWRPVEAYCAEHDIAFHHLQDWPGFKSGALNFALGVTDPRAEVIGVIDADYIVEPDYLRRCAPLFAQRDELGFVQSPQDYREWEGSAYYRRLYYSYDYFFAVSQVSRNERNGAIFGGTMGLIRRSALQDVGGWDEWCITEDAELSLRLLKAGWDGQHVERSFGHGVMPLSFEALKRQRFRWCFGGVQILRKHWRSLLPWDRSESNHLTFKQRYDYLAGGLQWFGSLLALGFAGLLLAGTLDLVVGSGYTFRRLSGAILVVPPLLLGVELARSVGLIRRRTGASLRDAFGALRIWLALGLTVAKACALGLVRPEGVFLRTPKTKGEGSWRDAVTANRVEVGLGLLLICCAPLAMLRIPSATAAVLGTLLAWHAAAFLFAPAQTVAALHADLPPELRRLRRNDWVRERLAATRKPIRIGAGAGALVGLGVALVLLLAPHPHAHVGPGPDVIGEARGRTSSSRTSPGTASTSATGGGLSRTGSGGTPSTPSGAANLSSSTSTVAGSQGVAAATHGAAVSTTLPGATPPSTRGAVSTTVAPGPPSTTPATVPTSSLPLPPTSRGRTSSPPTTRAHP